MDFCFAQKGVSLRFKGCSPQASFPGGDALDSPLLNYLFIVVIIIIVKNLFKVG